jgi:hypothetical protein
LFNFCHITLWMFVFFLLHITIYNYHHFTINKVIRVASQGHPFLNTLHMVEHELACFKIALKLHPFHQIITTTIFFNIFLKKEHFFPRHLSRKTIILNVIINTYELQNKIFVNVSFITQMMFKQCHQGCDVVKTQCCQLVHQLV